MTEASLPKPWEWEGPTKTIVEFIVATKIASKPYHWRVGAFHSGWWREVIENAETRSEVTGLPIFEIRPDEDPEAIIRRAPDGVFIIHQMRREFGPVIRELPRFYDAARLARIAKRAPPLAASG